MVITSTTALEITVRVLVATFCVLGIASYLILHTAGAYNLCVGPSRVHFGSKGVLSFLFRTLVSDRCAFSRARIKKERPVSHREQSTEIVLSGRRRSPKGMNSSGLIEEKSLMTRQAPPRNAPTRHAIILRITDGKSDPEHGQVTSSGTLLQTNSRYRFNSLDALYKDAAFCIETALGVPRPSKKESGDIRMFSLDPRTRLIFLFGTSSVRDAREGLDVSQTDFPVSCTSLLRAHAGFVRAYESHRIKQRVEEYVRAAIEELGSTRARIIVAGHSRGAVFAALIAAERSLTRKVVPEEHILRPSTRVRFIMCGCPKFLDPYSTNVLRKTHTFLNHVLVVQHANDVIPQLPLATTRSQSHSATSVNVVAYTAAERLTPHVIRLYSYDDREPDVTENAICEYKSSSQPPPALPMYHELRTYAASLRLESESMQVRARELSRAHHQSNKYDRKKKRAKWCSFLWRPHFKMKQE